MTVKCPVRGEAVPVIAEQRGNSRNSQKERRITDRSIAKYDFTKNTCKYTYMKLWVFMQVWMHEIWNRSLGVL